MSYLTIKFSSNHIRNNFSCGNAPLDNYITTQVSQDIKKKLTACFVIIDDNYEIRGYYTLSNASISIDDTPENIKTKMPRGYTALPVTLLGRLAVDSKSQGKKLGELLLIDALKRSFEVSETIGSNAIIVDPVDKQAVEFYRKYGFISLDSGRMFITMKTVGDLFNS